ncbi:Anti-sigma-K factor RskA [Amycolatopsis pretoriensis]|uniref:Regulator of SigK n=1 Tax=Amycolatopsis pretoriensis TaxID=218821 RepID=A0A1H5QID6_9PSEU|nr:anti-sigma factor [Amycolatopsis pretoriensis]SEF25922.1 Anti-sigma-K factor RskA [Amycolatopsis pretoriensis]
MTAELHTLTGAYALDALSDVERAGFERHLGECPACRQEVAELRATGARLGAADAVTPPPELRSLVLAAVARTRQLPPRIPVQRGGKPRRGRVFRLRMTLVAAAAAAVVAVGVGVVTSTPPAPVDSVLSAPDASAIQGTGEGHATLVVSRSRNQAVLLAADLPALDAGHVYQVWLIRAGEAHSAGILQPRMLMSDIPPGTDRIGITVEPAGGSAGPTTPAVTRISLA